MAAKRKRSGKTKNISVSLDAVVLKMLRERADAKHGGNLSAAIAEAAEVLHRHAVRGTAAGPGDAGLAGMRGGPTESVDDPGLAGVAIAIGGKEVSEDTGRPDPGRTPEPVITPPPQWV